MYLNIVSALRLPNEAISGTPQIAGPGTLGREKRSTQATAPSALPHPLLFDSSAQLEKASMILEGRQTKYFVQKGKGRAWGYGLKTTQKPQGCAFVSA